MITRSEGDGGRGRSSSRARLKSGDVVLLYGDLGAGKTAFVRGMARGLGADPDDVSSPTFTLVQEYSGAAATLYHVDLYRLDPDGDRRSRAGRARLRGRHRRDRMGGAVAGRPDDVVEVRLAERGDDQRTIDIRSRRPR